MKKLIILFLVLICTLGVTGCSEAMEKSDIENDTSLKNVKTEEHVTYVDDIMGMSGFYSVNENVHPSVYNFYVMDGENAVCIAEHWGETNEENCFSIDLDGDGISEFICNVTYGDGARATIVYHREGSTIYKGFADDLLDEKYDNLHYMSTYSYYLPEEEMVEIHYWIEEINGYKSKKYVIDLDKILYWETFAKLGN